MVFYGGEIMNRIKQLRKKQKLTQKELAEMAEIDQSDLSKIENDRKSITLDTAKKISRALGHSIEYIWPD